jgi:hypothetical protein
MRDHSRCPRTFRSYRGIFLCFDRSARKARWTHSSNPLLMSRGGGMPLVPVLLGVLGGATAFGFIGVFLRPTLLAVGLPLAG